MKADWHNHGQIFEWVGSVGWSVWQFARVPNVANCLQWLTKEGFWVYITEYDIFEKIGTL